LKNCVVRLEKTVTMLKSEYNRLKLAEQGLVRSISALVLGVVVYVAIDLIDDFLVMFGLNDKGDLPMKTKAVNYLAVCVKSVLFSVWTMGANLMAGALLT